jgi:hypothetical protein
MKTTTAGVTTLVAMAGAFALPALAEESQAELAKKSLNPVASLISVPFQLDFDRRMGPLEDGKQFQLTIKPVIPISISSDWNLISRTLVPVIHRNDVTPVSGNQTGIGDITQQFYFSPKAPTAEGWIWGVGPQVLTRVGDAKLSSDRWAVGPDLVVLKQEHGWTYGVLANHLWSVGNGNTLTPNISATYVQPFLSYTTPHFTTYGINTESTYNWKTNHWSTPINATVTQLMKIGDQHLTLQGGVRYWAASPDDIGPKGWGLRFAVNFLFPK